MFDEMLIVGMISIAFDGITAVTVNNQQLVSPFMNKLLHMCFLISLDVIIFMLFLYILQITGIYPDSRKIRAALYAPFGVNVIVIITNMNSLEYIEGEISNYSMGISAYACFVMAGMYILLSFITFLKKWSFLENHKRTSILTYLIVLVLVTGIKLINTELLITSVGVTVFLLGIYLNQEDPALKELSKYHYEMVMGFANLIENRDDNTGGHIKRTSAYVRLIANALVKKGEYADILTKDYIDNLCQAAPMHDIGKICVPDSILQKPGKLTDEEFAAMKLHAEKGGRIIKENFKKLGNEEYRKVAFEVAMYHHEKWNGRGYPVGISGSDIPLCARIMAVADVFDAISEKRCYRDAMPMDKCFEIISDGIGKDFDPIVAQTFVEIRDEVEAVHRDFKSASVNVYESKV